MDYSPSSRRVSGRCRAAVLVLTAACMGNGSSFAGAQCSPWELVSPHPHGRNLAAVVWGGDRFVAVGYSVTQWSADGETWEVGVHDGVHLNAVAWDGTAFVAVGDGGVIRRSADGASWDVVESPTTANLTGVAWGGGEFVAVSESGQALRSSAGVAWELFPLPAVRGAVRGITFGEGTFCIVGDSSTVITGSGTRWVDVGRSLDSSYLSLTSAAMLGGRLFVGGRMYGIQRAFDGAVWINVKSPWGTFLGRSGSELYISGYGAGIGTQEAVISSSADGITWVEQPGPKYSLDLRALAVGGGRAVAVGGEGGLLVRTSSGTWELASGRADPFSAIVTNGQVLVLGSGQGRFGGCALFTSTDGREWTCRQTGSPAVARLYWLEDRFVALGGGGLSWSFDGATWTSPADLPATFQLATDLVRFRGRYLLFAGLSGIPTCGVGLCRAAVAEVYASEDLESWHLVWQDAQTAGLVSVATNGLRLVATRCGENPYSCEFLDGLATSDDGETWTRLSLDEQLPGTTKVVWTGSRFVAAGGGIVMESIDGLQWVVISRSEINLTSLAWTGTALVGAGVWGQYPLVASSLDGRRWAPEYPFVQPASHPQTGEPFPLWDPPVSSVAGRSRLQMAVGPNGTLLRRECEPEKPAPRRRLRRGIAASQP